MLARGNRQVPEVVRAVCDRVEVDRGDLDLLVTNQPNRLLLRNWDRGTRDCRGNATATRSTSAAICSRWVSRSTSRLRSPTGRSGAGDIVMIAGFAHAGDFAGAAASSGEGGHSDHFHGGAA